jgi:protein TonB
MSLGSFRLAPRTAGQPSGAAAPQGVGGPLLPAQSQAAATEEPSSATPGAPGQAYLEAIRVRIREHLRYPLSLQRRGVQGTALIRIELSPEGACERVALAGSSGHAELDELALSATKAASGSGPLGPPPTGVGRTIQVPVEFVLAR